MIPPERNEYSDEGGLSDIVQIMEWRWSRLAVA